MKRRTFIKTTGTLAASLAVSTMLTAAAWAADTIKIGTVAPKTGPLAGGAVITHWPNVDCGSIRSTPAAV